jgi:hypothetical protein
MDVVGCSTSYPWSAMHFRNSGGSPLGALGAGALSVGVSVVSLGAGPVVACSPSPPQLESTSPITMAPIVRWRFIARSPGPGR